MRPVASGAAALAAALLTAASAQAQASYTVRLGDTLSGIAAARHTTVSTLARLNGLDPDGVLLTGARLRLPAVAAGAALRPYVVQWGDTLSGIAARSGWSVRALARANGLDPGRVLLAGATIRIPGTVYRVATAASATSTATATPIDVPSALERWSLHYGVDPHLVRALAWQESGFQSRVVSPAGALGVMQVTPDTWRYVEQVLLGRPVEHTADGNIRVGVAFLGHLLREFGGSERLAVAAYYQGPRSVRLQGLLPETRQYVRNVLALRTRM